MRETFKPGVGFPSRLRAYLARTNLRFGQVEADGVCNAETVSNWVHARVLPEKHLFLRFCERYGMNTAEARALLRKPGEPLLQIDPAGRHVEQVLTTLDRTEKYLAKMTNEQRRTVETRLKALLKTIRDAKKTTDGDDDRSAAEAEAA